MAQVKFGFGQFSSPPPKVYRQFENAWIILMVPALAGLVDGWGIADPVTVKRIGLLILFSGSLVKFGGMLLGNGQTYADKEIQNNQNP